MHARNAFSGSFGIGHREHPWTQDTWSTGGTSPRRGTRATRHKRPASAIGHARSEVAESGSETLGGCLGRLRRNLLVAKTLLEVTVAQARLVYHCCPYCAHSFATNCAGQNIFINGQFLWLVCNSLEFWSLLAASHVDCECFVRAAALTFMNALRRRSQARDSTCFSAYCGGTSGSFFHMFDGMIAPMVGEPNW